MSADPFTPAARAAMLAPPVTPIQRKDFVHNATPAIAIKCRLYHTVPSNPGPLPTTLPPRNFSRPLKDHLAADAPVNEQAVSQDTALANWTIINPGEYSAEESTFPDPDMIFTHGRGSKLDNEAIVAFTEGWARTQVTLNFENSGDLNTRAGIFHALMLALPSAISLGGRSMGARAAARGSMYSPVRKLVMFTYPLIRGLDERYEELLELKSDLDVLFVLGDSDALCHEMHLNAIRRRMRARSWWVRMINGDHALWYDPDEKRDALCNIAGQIAAMWNVSKDPLLTELTLDWDKNANQPKWTTWMAPAEPARQPTTFNINIPNSLLRGGGGTFNFNL